MHTRKAPNHLPDSSSFLKGYWLSAYNSPWFVVMLDNTPMTHQSKKKRIEDEALPEDVGKQPLQLQRRRVWRACESCR
jgi:hypothetical protein